jgi:F-type H+-transporting ATPase subunit delta
MQNLAVARKYARALFQAALESPTGEKIALDMDSLLALGEDDPAFLKFLLAPEVPAEQKGAFLATIFEPRVDVAVYGLLRLLLEKGRMNELTGIARVFRTLWEEHKGIVRVDVETSTLLPEDQEARLRDELEKFSGKQVILEKKTNPSILGGIIVHYKDKILDRSIRRGLKDLAESLLEAS